MHSRCSGQVGFALALSVMLACRPEASSSTPPPAGDAPRSIATPPPPANVDEELEHLRRPSTRAEALARLDSRIAAAPDDAARRALVDAVVPAFVEIWGEAAPHRLRMLRLCMALRHPGAAPVWNLAIGLDGTAASYDQTLLALAAVVQTQAKGSVETIIEALRALLEHPQYDGGDDAGAVRVAMAGALGRLGDRRAVPVLLHTLEQPRARQPVAVHREAVDALGRIRDPAAIDALLTVAYRVPDAMTSANLFERSKAALAAIGEPAVARTIDMLRGRHQAVQELAAHHSLQQRVVATGAAMVLGVIGDPAAVPSLLGEIPTADCRARRRTRPDEPDTLAYRAVVANALGLIGDPRAVSSLCRCATASRNPTDMFPIAEALARIGGTEATACLVRVIEHGVYDADNVASTDFVHEIRWEAARFAVLAAPVAELDRVHEAVSRARQDPVVSRHMGDGTAGLELRRQCGADLTCLLETLDDPKAAAFDREIAAVTAARIAPGRRDVAERIAAAYDVPDPDARVTMAWLAAQTLGGVRCPACAQRLEDHLEQATATRLPSEYMLSVLMARYAVARLR